MKKNILIIGIGNSLMHDDGLGVYVAKKISRFSLPASVVVLNCCSDLLRLIPDNDESYYKIIIVDAIKWNKKPGSIYRFEVDKINNIGEQFSSLHMISSIVYLKLLTTLYPKLGKSRIVLTGIEPENIDVGIGLSFTVKKQVNQLIHIICTELYDSSGE